MIVLLFFAANVRAQNTGKVEVTVVVILASEDGNKIDAQLSQIAEEVRRKNPSLKSFRVKTQITKNLAEDEKATFNVVDDQTASIVVQHIGGEDKKVSLAVTAPKQGEIVYSTVYNKFLPILTNYTTRERHEKLILAISVEPQDHKDRKK